MHANARWDHMWTLFSDHKKTPTSDRVEIGPKCINSDMECWSPQPDSVTASDRKEVSIS